MASETRLLGSPLRNLVSVVLFVLAVGAFSTVGYMYAGWSFPDAIYMVVLTVFSVGYGEVRPIDTAFLHVLTIATMTLGCTGMIILTGALVQFFTAYQLKELLGLDREKSEIDRLSGHVIVCGYGRIGVMLAKDLAAGGAKFIILERDEDKLVQARAAGHLSLQGDATDERSLQAAGIERARTLATVLPNDAANVFITLSARSLNPKLEIIARGEAPSTEGKLRQAGADKVVLPTHIGAERIAEMILFPETARFLRGSERMKEMEKGLHDLGLELEVVTAAEGGAVTGQTVGEVEKRAKGAFFIVQLNHADGQVITRPGPEVKIEAGDGVVVVARSSRVAVAALFDAPTKVQAGRSRF